MMEEVGVRWGEVVVLVPRRHAEIQSMVIPFFGATTVVGSAPTAAWTRAERPLPP